MRAARVAILVRVFEGWCAIAWIHHASCTAVGAAPQSTPHTVHALSTECSKPRENSVQSAQLQLLHSVRSAQECTEDLSTLSAECFWRSVFQAKCTVHGSRPAVRTSINVVQTQEFRVGGGSKRCLNGLERQWQVIMAKTNHFRRCLTFRQGAVLYS